MLPRSEETSGLNISEDTVHSTRDYFESEYNLRRLIVALVILALLAGTQLAPVLADATIASQTSLFSTAYSSQRKIARNVRGEIFAVYVRAIENISQVFVAVSRDNGASWQDLGRVSDGEHESVRTAIAIDSRGNLHVAWTKFIEEYGQIYYRNFQATSATWSREYALTSGDAYSGYPSIAIDSRDVPHIVWYGFDGRAYQIYYSRFDGFAWSSGRQLSQGFPDSVNPAIAIDRNNVIHVAWYKNDGRHYQIYVVNSTGDWQEQRVISSGDTDSYNPTIAIDQVGEVHVAWDKQVDTRTQLFYSRFANGRWSPQQQLTFGESSAENPSIAIDSNGRLVIAYNKRDGEVYTIRYVNEWESEVKLTSDGGNIYPSIRWSFYNNHEETVPLLDLVWTHKAGNSYEVKYQAIGSGAIIVPPEGTRFSYFAIGLVVVILLVAAYAVTHRLLSRSKKPETDSSRIWVGTQAGNLRLRTGEERIEGAIIHSS
jgi:hypothetical protein